MAFLFCQGGSKTLSLPSHLSYRYHSPPLFNPHPMPQYSYRLRSLKFPWETGRGGEGQRWGRRAARQVSHITASIGLGRAVGLLGPSSIRQGHEPIERLGEATMGGLLHTRIGRSGIPPVVFVKRRIVHEKGKHAYMHRRTEHGNGAATLGNKTKIPGHVVNGMRTKQYIVYA